jgi:hypothetical protein
MLVGYGGHGSPVSTMSVALERSTWIHLAWHWIIYGKYPKTWQGLKWSVYHHQMHWFKWGHDDFMMINHQICDFHSNPSFFREWNGNGHSLGRFW